MKVKTLQVVWHDREPVYSVDFHPDGTLFTAGGDKEIKAWEVRRCYRLLLLVMMLPKSHTHTLNPRPPPTTRSRAARTATRPSRTSPRCPATGGRSTACASRRRARS
jgi:WD40 repeat protein